VNDTLMEAINAYWMNNYRPPSISDLCEATGLARSQVWRALVQMAFNGSIRLTPGTARSIIPGWVVQAIDDAA